MTQFFENLSVFEKILHFSEM